MEDNKIHFSFSTQKENVSNYYSENYKELRRGRYISAGRNNDHFILINSLLTKSTVHQACIQAKCNMITGNGISYNADNIAVAKFADNVYAEDTLEETIQKCAEDAIIYNGFALKITLDSNKNIGKYEHIPLDNLRFEYDKRSILFSKDWYNNSPRIEYPLFDFTKQNDISILYVDLTKNNNFYYPVGEYVSAYDYIVSEEHISIYHRNNANNGWYPSFHLHIPKNVPQELRPVVADELRKSYQGVKKGNNLFLTFGDPGAEKPTLDAINSNTNDEKFLELLNKCEEKILQAHQMSNPTLAAISVGQNSLISNGQDITNLTNIFNKIYVQPKQKSITKWFNRLLKFNGIFNEDIKLNEFQFNFNEKIDLNNTVTILTSTYNEDTKKILLANEGYTNEDIEVLLTNQPITPVNQTIEQSAEINPTNDVLTNLTGRQMQNLMRIVNKFEKGTLTREQAIMMIKSAYNLTDEQADLFIKNEENND